MQKDRPVAPKIKKWRPFKFSHRAKTTYPSDFLKNYIFFSRPSIMVLFFRKKPNFQRRFSFIFQKFFKIFFEKKIFFFEGGPNFRGGILTPPNKKNGKKTHRTCSQYINLKIETIYRSIGPLVKKLLMLKVSDGLFCPPPYFEGLKI